MNRDQMGMIQGGPRAGTHTTAESPVWLTQHADTGEWALYVYSPKSSPDGCPLEYCEMPARPFLVKWMRQNRCRKVAAFLRREGSLRDVPIRMGFWRTLWNCLTRRSSDG